MSCQLTRLGVAPKIDGGSGRRSSIARGRGVVDVAVQLLARVGGIEFD
jgi:hypothetical protein